MNMKGRLHDKEIVQKLWQAFRIGQSTYIAYVIGLINFMLILYRLAGIDKHIEPIPFAILIIIIIVPAGVVFGVMHIRHQVPTENKIMTHYNPYVYKVVPNSKETMAIKTTLWGFEQAKMTNNFIELQADMNKKLWHAINELMHKEVFTKEDEAKMDKIKRDAGIIKEGVLGWTEKYQQLYEGKMTKDIEGSEEFTRLEDKN